MTKKTSRRRRASPAKHRRKTFTIVVEAQPMVVSYEPHWMGDMAKFEFRSPNKPPRRIPLSDSGYLSHYAAMEDVKSARSPEDFVRNLVLLRLNSRASRPADPRQLALFG
jgi:hypothetical protein